MQNAPDVMITDIDCLYQSYTPKHFMSQWCMHFMSQWCMALFLTFRAMALLILQHFQMTEPDIAQLTPSLCLALRWRHNGHDGVSNHQPHHCLFNRLFGCRSKKTSKLRVTGLCVGNSLVTGEFPAQMASNAENVSIWWRHHGIIWNGTPFTNMI